MQLYCGIDLHSNNSVVSLINDEDQLICEKRLDNNLETIEHHLQPYQDAISGVVVESTYNWYWLVDGLMEHGYPVQLANTLAIQQYNGINTPTMRRMRATWRTCCGSLYCPPAISTRRRCVIYATCCAAGCCW